MDADRKELLKTLIDQGAVRSDEIKPLSKAIQMTDQEAIDASLKELKPGGTPPERVAGEIFKSVS